MGNCAHKGVEDRSMNRQEQRKKNSPVHSRGMTGRRRGCLQQSGCVYVPNKQYVKYRGQDTDAGSTISWYQDENIGLLLLKLVWKYKLLIFSKTTCPRCDEIKMRLDEVGIDYCFINLDEEEYGPEMMRYVGKLTGAFTVPRVFCKGRFLGGGDETLKELAKLRNGQKNLLDGLARRRSHRWW